MAETGGEGREAAEDGSGVGHHDRNDVTHNRVMMPHAIDAAQVRRLPWDSAVLERELTEAELLDLALHLAVDNAADGQLPFGAVVVRDGRVLGRGVNTVLRDKDPVAHAEVAAVRDACRRIGVLHLTGATVVSSCEPCAVCHAFAAAVGVARILYAAAKEDVPDLGYPAPAELADVAVLMQQVLRSALPEQIVHVPVSSAGAPFERYLAGKAAL